MPKTPNLQKISLGTITRMNADNASIQHPRHYLIVLWSCVIEIRVIFKELSDKKLNSIYLKND